jgi:hypothetical protein
MACVGLGLGAFLKNLRGVLGASLGMGLILLILVQGSQWGDLGVLTIGIPVGVGTYLLLLWWFEPIVLQEGWAVMPAGLQKKVQKGWL